MEKPKENIEPNSHKHHREKLKAVVHQEDLVSNKKGIGSKFASRFLDDASKNVKDYLIWDVVVPGIKDAILDAMSMIFFGETVSRGNRGGFYHGRNERKSRSDYRSYYDSRDSYRSSYRRDDDRYESRERRETDYRNIVVREKRPAEDIVNQLRERIIECGEASIADLFDLLDLPTEYQQNNYGWRDERDIGLRRINGGYLIDVAEARYLT